MAHAPHWPPRSPHEALLLTPSGRDKLRRLAERASPSPSPIRRSKSMGTAALDMDMDREDEDDEETLQLQLQEIQARLKLKKLQKKSRQASDSENETARAGLSRSGRPNSVAADRAESRLAGVRAERLGRSKSQASVTIPVSPIRKTQPPHVQRSPGRVLLGIDKGLKGSDISLKRAPSLRRREEPIPNRLADPFVPRAGSQASSRTHGAASSSQEAPSKSFSERLAAIRAQDTDRQEREIRIRKNRSQAFDIDHEQMRDFKENAVSLPEAPRKPESFSREDVLGSANTSSIPRSRTAPDLRSAMRNTSDPMVSVSASTEQAESRAAVPASRKKAPAKPPNEVTESEASQFEPFSSQHLSKRIIPHQILTRNLSGKKLFLIPDLLRIVKGPDFSGPDIEEDVVVFAIISSKSEPKVHQANASAKNQKRGKFMVMSLTDLKWELDLFLFDSAFEKFWKITPGTIIAILNPIFMPPPKGRADTGKFSLTLNSDADTVLEVGTARDLGFCKSIKKDGKTCDSWVDKRHTEFCDFHVNLNLQKTHSSRMEVNSMNFGKGDRGGYGKRKVFNSRDMTGHFAGKEREEADNKMRYDKESHSQIYIGKRSTVNMLDDVDFDPDAFHRGSTKEERMTRQILAKEKERDLEKKLATLGSGIGADYARVRRHESSQPDPSSSYSVPDAPDAGKLGLLNGKATEVALSPIKRKRTNNPSSTAAVGWGGNLTKELGRMKNGESLQPRLKKTRFVTEKGIREAGRESLGGDAMKAAVDDDDDDDDDLDIVRD